jgi:chitin-binding protein
MSRRWTLTLAVTAALAVGALTTGPAQAAPVEYPTWSPTVNPTASDTPVATPTWSPSPIPGPACTADFRVVTAWATGFFAMVTVTAGTSPIKGWTVSWTFNNGQKITSHFNGDFTSSGATQTVRNVPWNGAIPPGRSNFFGFDAEGAPVIPQVTCVATA